MHAVLEARQYCKDHTKICITQFGHSENILQILQSSRFKSFSESSFLKKTSNGPDPKVWLDLCWASPTWGASARERDFKMLTCGVWRSAAWRAKAVQGYTGRSIRSRSTAESRHLPRDGGVAETLALATVKKGELTEGH
jgi:hypothetical protein